MKLKIVIIIVIGLLAGFIGMATWRIGGSFYYDIKFLHEQRAKYDEAVRMENLRQQLIQQQQKQQQQLVK